MLSHPRQALDRFQAFWNCLINTGISENTVRDERKYVRFTNVVAVLTALSVFVYIPFSFYKGNFVLAGLQAIDTLCVLAVLWLNNLGHHKTARLAYLFVINSFVLINACFIGYESRVHEFFYISYVVPFLLFSVKDYRNIAVGVLMPIFCFNLYTHVYPVFSAYNLSLAEQLGIYEINMWMKFVLFGAAIYILAYYNFVTEKELDASNEKLKDQATKLKRSNQDLEQFAYIISHDLKAPVRNINSFMKLLMNKYSQDLSTDAKQFIEHSKTSAERLTRQIDDMLCYCRVDRNLPPVSNVDVNHMLKTITMELSQKIAERNARITVENEIPMLQNLHSSMLHHVFQNLISNGLKFNTNSNPEVKINCTEQDGEILFSVEDNGIGIEQGFENKLFQMFKRLHTQEEFEGTGIGLAVCKKIVNFYKGEIWYESEPEKGTTFYFTLPKEHIRPVTRKREESPRLVIVSEAAA